MKFSRHLLNDYLAKTTPKEAVIKKYAHAVTLAACGLVIPSIWAIFLRHQGIKENEPELVWGSETLWKIHSGIIICACVLWIIERPQKTKYLPVDPVDDER
jgi:hypothetical protein